MADGIDDHRLRYLFAAAHHGSVRAAADALGVNSSVVSRQISLLEQSLDVLLLERHSRGVRATEAGALLVEHFHRRVADRDDTIAKLRDIQGLRRGNIDVAVGEGFVSDLMSGSLRAFWKRHPRLTMSLRVGGTNDIMRWVAEDQVHIGLVYNPPGNSAVRSCAASRQPICLIARRDHPLIRKGSPVSLREIKDQPLGLLHASYGVRQVVAMAEAAEKVGLSPVFTTSSFGALGEFVKAGLGVTLLPPFSLAAEIAGGSLAAIPVRSPILTTPEAHVITRSGRELSNAAKSFLRHVTTQMRSFTASPSAGPSPATRRSPQ